MQAKLISGVASGSATAAEWAAPAKANTRQNSTESARPDVVALSARAMALQLHEQGEPTSAIAVILDVSMAQVNDYLRTQTEQIQTNPAGSVQYLNHASLTKNNNPDSAIAKTTEHSTLLEIPGHIQH